MRLQNYITTLICLFFFSPAFSHSVFSWLMLEGNKPQKVICLTGNKKNGTVIMMYSILNSTSIDYCYFGEVENGKPSGDGREFFKFDGIGFNRDAIINSNNFELNGFYLEIKSTFSEGRIAGKSELLFYRNSRFPRGDFMVEKVLGNFNESVEDENILDVSFLKKEEIISYQGSSISKEQVRQVAEHFARTGSKEVMLTEDLKGLFTFDSAESFIGTCDKMLSKVEGIKRYTSGINEITCYVKNYEVFPVRIVNSTGERLFVLTDLEEGEIKRIPIVADTISDINLFASLENARNMLFKQEFIESRTLTANYEVFEHSPEFDVLLKYSEGKISMKVISNEKLVNPIISWKRNLIIPLDSKFKTQFEDGYYFWWDTIHGNGNSITNEYSWRLFDSIHFPFPIEYFGMKFEIVCTNSKYNIELPIVFISESDRNEIKRLGSEAIKANLLVQKEKEAKEKARREEQEAKRLALQKQQEETKKAQEIKRTNRLKSIQKGDVVCYSQGWEYSEGIWVFHESGKFDMIATLIVDDVSPNGNVIFVVNNVTSSSDNRYQSMNYGNLVIKENQKISVAKADLIIDHRFQFCK